MKIIPINQTKYVQQVRPQMVMYFLNSEAHYIVYANGTKFILIKIIDRGSLTSMGFIIYVKLKMCLTALLNQGQNQQSVKNIFTLCNYFFSTITIKSLLSILGTKSNTVQLSHNRVGFR